MLEGDDKFSVMFIEILCIDEAIFQIRRKCWRWRGGLHINFSLAFKNALIQIGATEH